jgi:hypothetical protein
MHISSVVHNDVKPSEVFNEIFECLIDLLVDGDIECLDKQLRSRIALLEVVQGRYFPRSCDDTLSRSEDCLCESMSQSSRSPRYC